MAEVQWSEEGEEAPRKKKRVPTWVWWGCGGGCLLLTLIATVSAILIGKFVKDTIDPEVAWNELREVLPYDQRPEGWDARGNRILGFGQYFLVPASGGAILIVQRFRSSQELEAMFDPSSRQNKGVFGLGEIQNAELGTIDLQDRSVRCLHFQAWVPQAAKKDGPVGASLRIDLTGSGSIPVLVQITMQAESERVPDELARDLLAPFDVWRGR